MFLNHYCMNIDWLSGLFPKASMTFACHPLTVMSICVGCVSCWYGRVYNCQFVDIAFELFIDKSCDYSAAFSADFGLSKMVSNDVTMQTVCGTPGYCGKLCRFLVLLWVAEILQTQLSDMFLLCFTIDVVQIGWPGDVCIMHFPVEWNRLTPLIHL